MAEQISKRLVRAVARDLLERYPEELVAHSRDLPRRMPADHAQRKVAQIIARLDDDEAAALIRYGMDAALFRMFYLLCDPADLDGLSVNVIEASEPDWDGDPFHETYRMVVDPGGILVHDEG